MLHQTDPVLKKGERLAAEVEEGNREYKFKLTGLSDSQLTHRITQLNWRLNEGNGEGILSNRGRR